MMAPILAISTTWYALYYGLEINHIMVVTSIIYILLIASVVGILWYMINNKDRSRQTLAFLPCMII